MTRPTRRAWAGQVAAASEPRSGQPAHRQPGRGSRLPALGRSRLGERHAVHLAVGLAVLASRAAGLTSATYARDYNEVKSVGGKVSAVRTAEQTQIARFWFEGPGAWNTIARTVATGRGLDARDSARVLALMNMAMADAYIAGFKIRYVYDLWRPVTAIREGDNDGNDATVGDPTWDSHQNTPAVSDYPSTQSTFSAAAAMVLATVLGGDQAAFTVHKRQALRRDHPIVRELLPGGAGER